MLFYNYMINLLKRYIALSMTAGLFTAAMSSCAEDDLLSKEPANEGGNPSAITFLCSDMLESYIGDYNPASRAGGQKNPEEKEIKTLHIFFFNYDTGELLTKSTYHNFPAYQKISGKSILNIPTGGEEDLFGDDTDNVHIVAIANIDATDEESADIDYNQFYTQYSTGGRIQKESRDSGGDPYEIKTYEDLTKWVYYPRIRMSEDGSGDISKLPETGMPMIGELGNRAAGEAPVKLSSKPTSPYIVNMQALMAKVNVSVELDPDQSTSEFPVLKITGYGVRNMPIAVPFSQPTTKVQDGIGGKPTGASDDERHANYFKKYEVTDVPMFHKGDNQTGNSHFVCDDEAHEFMTTANVTINKDSEPVTFSYYTFENINLPDYNAKRANNVDAFNEALEPQYPTGVKDADKQRWKSTFAYSDRASALVLKGEYTTHQGLKYNAQFTVYLGCTVNVEDPNIDFQVKRNHRYDNNIVIHGLDYIRNSDDDVYNFDGRVNVVDDNPFYLAIVNERKVDAHATALPMDVWFMLREDGNGNVDDVPWNSEITFTVRNHNTEAGNWIRMEKIPRSVMEEGKDVEVDGEIKKIPFYPGTGARDYFTTDLVTSTLWENGEADGKEHGWKITVDGDVDLSRTRIYFYIDENVPTSNNPTNYGDRTAIIDIEYNRTDNDGNVLDHRNRTLEIEQRALLKVETTGYVSWMEVYEEYLDHNDPLDPHTEYGEFYKDGLPWGLENVNVNSNFTNDEVDNPNTSITTNPAYQVYYKIGGFKMTVWAVNDREDTDPISNVTLFNAEKPASAFHYCFGKNKRNSDGSAVYEYEQTRRQGIFGSYVTGNTAKGWYMPGITELENALLIYYNDFSDFRGNFYWSAACANKSTQTGNNDQHARATKIVYENSKYDYAKSHPQDGNNASSGPGYQTRDTKNRIRAFYRVD